MSRVKRISEVFDTASKIRSKEERINYLRSHADTCMRYIVQGAYHPNVEWLLPKGIPPYKPAPTMDTDGILHKEFHKLYLFCKGGHDTLKQFKREKLFIDLLEILHPEDAILICNVKDKKINYPFLTYLIFKEAFPDWLPEPREEDIVHPGQKRNSKKKEENA